MLTLTTILLLLLFIFICWNITSNIEKFHNLNDIDLSNDKSDVDDDIEEKSEQQSHLQQHPAEETNKYLENNIKINIYYPTTTEDKKKEHKKEEHKKEEHKKEEHKKEEHKKDKKEEVQKNAIDRDFIMNPSYLRYGNALGSIDHAKISKNIFADMVPDCYTILKEEYINFPLQRYSVTDLANMGVYK